MPLIVDEPSKVASKVVSKSGVFLKNSTILVIWLESQRICQTPICYQSCQIPIRDKMYIPDWYLTTHVIR